MSQCRVSAMQHITPITATQQKQILTFWTGSLLRDDIVN